MNDPTQPAPTLSARKPEAGLHMVATPIGSARDITLRALDILAGADVLAAEDTRTLRHLMEIHGIPVNGRLMIPYHDHNGEAARPRILGALEAGKSVAYASEAGTPLIADPGLKLARAAMDAGYKVLAAPGASAVLTALTVAGLPTDRFLFAGFPPAAAGARRTWLTELRDIQATIVIYESPKRTGRTLAELAELFGADRQAAVCRELTKRFEEVRRDSLEALAGFYADQDPRGEVVLVIDRGTFRAPEAADIDAALQVAIAAAGGRVKVAANEIAVKFGLSKRDVYQRALSLAEKDDSAEA